MMTENDSYLIRLAVTEAAAFMSAPHVVMRPRIFPDGDQWCALYGDDLMEGVAGFGDTPAAACAAFDKAWATEKTPAGYDRRIAELQRDDLPRPTNPARPPKDREWA